MPGHAVEDLTWPIRFPDKIVDSRGQHLLALGDESRSCHGHDLHFPPAIQRPDTPRGLLPIHHRHSQVHPDEVAAASFEISRLPVLPFSGQPHLESGVFHQPLQHEPVFLVVFHDQNTVIGLARLNADRQLLLCPPKTSPPILRPAPPAVPPGTTFLCRARSRPRWFPPSVPRIAG